MTDHNLKNRIHSNRANGISAVGQKVAAGTAQQFGDPSEVVLLGKVFWGSGAISGACSDENMDIPLD